MVLLLDIALALLVLVAAGFLFVVGMALYRSLKGGSSNDDTKGN